MYVDFNGKRYEWAWSKEMLARVITAAIVVVGVLFWVLWPREREVQQVRQPVPQNQPAVTQPKLPDYIPPGATVERDGPPKLSDCPYGSVQGDCGKIGRTAEQSRNDREHGCPSMLYWSQRAQRCQENPYSDR